MKYCKRITGQVIGRLRVQKELSQKVLAELAGITRSHLSLVESGRKGAGIELLWRIAEALNMRLSELIDIVEEEHEKTAGSDKR